MISILRFRPAAGFTEQFVADAEVALTVLSARPGFVRGELGRAVDDEGLWLLHTEWESVGAYRRGLGGYEVKLKATMLLGQALDEPSAFESLIGADPAGISGTRPSDRATDQATGDRTPNDETG